MQNANVSSVRVRDEDRHSIAVAIGDGLPIEEIYRNAFSGSIYLLSPRSSSLALTNWARQLIEEAFAPLDPLTAQHELPVEKFVEIVGPLKPRFIHHARTHELLREYLIDLGFDRETTYIDVPRMRAVTSDGYLVSGVGHKQPPHRDTWWSSPFQQIQFWMPIFPMLRECSMEFYPYYSRTAIANTSEQFNLYRWNAVGRKNAAQHTEKQDTRGIPEAAEELSHGGSVQVVLPVGGAVVFSANELHATTTNTTGRTRFSIDFRLLDVEHVRAGVGAENLDTACKGIALRDFRRLSDAAEFPNELVERYDSGLDEVPEAVLVYTPEGG